MSDLRVIPVPADGAEDGSTFRISHDGEHVERIPHTEGRPLGIEIDLPSDRGGSAYHMVTGVREHDGRPWLGSLHEPAVAVIEL